MIIDLTEYEIKAILEVRAANVDPNRVGKEEYADWMRLCARIEALAFKAQGSSRLVRTRKAGEIAR